MPTVSLKDAEAGFSNLVDKAIKGEFVTITRHGKPAFHPRPRKLRARRWKASAPGLLPIYGPSQAVNSRATALGHGTWSFERHRPMMPPANRCRALRFSTRF